MASEELASKLEPEAASEDPEPLPQPGSTIANEATKIEMVREILTMLARQLSGKSRYSTVTVLARLRGWSTLRPRARAMS